MNTLLVITRVFVYLILPMDQIAAGQFMAENLIRRIF